MHTIDKQAMLAFFCYNEKQFEFFCKDERHGFSGAKFHSRQTTTDYFGYLDHGGGLASVFARGTDGDNRMQKAVSWFRNGLATDANSNGMRDGFEMSAASFLHFFETDLLKFKTLWFFGHSAAASFLPDVAFMMKNKKQELKISGRTFCAAPSGNREFAKAFNAAIPDWLHFEMEGDYIRSGFIRKAQSGIEEGVDVGLMVELPPVGIIQRMPLLRAFAHSPKRICRSLMKTNPERIEELRWVRERCVN